MTVGLCIDGDALPTAATADAHDALLRLWRLHGIRHAPRDDRLALDVQRVHRQQIRMLWLEALADLPTRECSRWDGAFTLDSLRDARVGGAEVAVVDPAVAEALGIPSAEGFIDIDGLQVVPFGDLRLAPSCQRLHEASVIKGGTHRDTVWDEFFDPTVQRLCGRGISGGRPAHIAIIDRYALSPKGATALGYVLRRLATYPRRPAVDLFSAFSEGGHRSDRRLADVMSRWDSIDKRGLDAQLYLGSESSRHYSQLVHDRSMRVGNVCIALGNGLDALFFADKAHEYVPWFLTEAAGSLFERRENLLRQRATQRRR